MSDYDTPQAQQPVYVQDEPSYSPFFPILIVLSILTIANLFQFYWVLDQKSILNDNYDKSVKAIQNYQNVEKQVQGFALDLIELAKNNKRAAQVVTELDLKVNNNAPASN